MRYMALPVSFRWDEEFVAAIDAARGDVPRSVWVRRAVEQALGDISRLQRVGPGPSAVVSAAPAEQPTDFYRGPQVEAEFRESAAFSRRHAPTCRCPVCVPARS